MKIYPLNILKALSMALELSTRGLSRHHWRTAMVASRIARYIGVNEQDHINVLYAALIHDIGAASSWEETENLRNLRKNININTHAEVGYQLLKDSAQLGQLAPIIRHHHDYWDGSSPSGLRGKEIPLLSRIITLADRLEVLLRDDTDIFLQKPRIMAALSELSGRYFDPDLFEALQEISLRESFWIDLTNLHYYRNFFTSVDVQGMVHFSIEDILSIANVFAGVIDRTSAFTAEHSKSVAKVAAKLAELKGFSGHEVMMMRIAGLFHDLGKLAVPNRILEKPGKLTDLEFSTIKYHPYYTYRILQEIDGFQDIAEWAAYHHETLDGTGYPFRIKEDDLKLGSRIVAVADVFVALTEHRPYRRPLPLKKVREIMSGMVAHHKLDGGVVELIFSGDDFSKEIKQS